MAAIVADKYHLKSIHEEIALFDRKLAHLINFEKFESDSERDVAAHKLTTKRETLVKTARRLAAEGVEFKPNELPRSLRPNDEATPQVEAPVEIATPAEAPQQPPVLQQSGNRQSSNPHAGTSLDWQASVRQYLEKKGKADRA